MRPSLADVPGNRTVDAERIDITVDPIKRYYGNVPKSVLVVSLAPQTGLPLLFPSVLLPSSAPSTSPFWPVFCSPTPFFTLWLRVWSIGPFREITDPGRSLHLLATSASSNHGFTAASLQGLDALA